MGDKTADKIRKVSKTSSQDNSVTNEEENIGTDRDHIEKGINLQKKNRKLLTIQD